MTKVGRPGIDGQHVVVKLPNDLLGEVDSLWPKARCVSRNDFIRKALWEEVNRAKRGLVEVPAQ